MLLPCPLPSLSVTAFRSAPHLIASELPHMAPGFLYRIDAGSMTLTVNRLVAAVERLQVDMLAGGFQREREITTVQRIVNRRFQCVERKLLLGVERHAPNRQ